MCRTPKQNTFEPLFLSLKHKPMCVGGGSQAVLHLLLHLAEQGFLADLWVVRSWLLVGKDLKEVLSMWVWGGGGRKYKEERSKIAVSPFLAGISHTPFQACATKMMAGADDQFHSQNFPSSLHASTPRRWAEGDYSHFPVFLLYISAFLLKSHYLFLLLQAEWKA